MGQLNEFKTGDIVEVKNAYFKNDNGLYFVANSKGDITWCGDEYCLNKICKNGKLSTNQHNISFWPLTSFSNNRAKNAEAKKWNAEHATIEKIENITKTFIVEYFEVRAKDSEKQVKYSIYNFGEENTHTQKAKYIAKFYQAKVEELQATTL